MMPILSKCVKIAHDVKYLYKFMNASDYGSRLKDERNRKGLTQEELAQALGTSRGTVANCEIGKSFLDMKLLERADQAGVDILFIVTGRRMHSNLNWRLLQAINVGINNWASEHNMVVSTQNHFLLQKLLYEKFSQHESFDSKEIDNYLRSAA
ncbi:helix-turn-helix domain-containing protein [Janthinobacterium aestuarii]